MTQAPLLRRITDYANRADPYPLYAELRKTPVLQEEDGGPFVISTYWDVQSLLHDPRISSDASNLTAQGDELAEQEEEEEEEAALPLSFLRLDPPEHDRLRRMTNRPFGPPQSPRRVHDMRGELAGIVSGLIAGFGVTDRIDVVDQFSYPFPVTVICRLLGVPREDEARFHSWADTIAAGLDPVPGDDPTERNRVTHEARMQLGMYLAGLVEERGKTPGDDMLSELVTSHGLDGPMTTMEVLSTAALLLIAGRAGWRRSSP